MSATVITHALVLPDADFNAWPGNARQVSTGAHLPKEASSTTLIEVTNVFIGSATR